MALLDLSDVGQALEILRRTRAQLPEGPIRDAIDRQLVTLCEQINRMVRTDERLQQDQEAKRKLHASKPPGVNWTMLELNGELPAMIDRVVAGEDPTHVWSSRD